MPSLCCETWFELAGQLARKATAINVLPNAEDVLLEIIVVGSKQCVDIEAASLSNTSDVHHDVDWLVVLAFFDGKLESTRRNLYDEFVYHWFSHLSVSLLIPLMYMLPLVTN